MGTAKPNYRLVKSHRNYTLEEVARLFGLHRNTVRAWLKAGLQAIDQRRPLLIHGTALVAFLRERRSRQRCQCQPGEMFCLRCRAPRFPAGNTVAVNWKSATLGAMSGQCSVCAARMFRRVSRANLGRALGRLEILPCPDPGPVQFPERLAPNQIPPGAHSR